MADDAFTAEFDRLLREYAGLPSRLYDAERLSEVVGARVLLKREDLNHTGAHKIRNVLGQALLTTRMGKKRVIAETGAGQHGVATATACAYFGLECVVYMGEVDTERQALNVARMKMLGAEVVPVTTGSRTLKDAINEALRDWVANVDSTHYLLGTAAGAHPFPAMVRDFTRGIGDEARAQTLELVGRLPDAALACVGGGSNAIGLFTASSTTRRSGSTGSRPAATASRPGGTLRRSPPARSASCTARGRTCCKTTTARRSSRTRSRPGSTTRASGPSTRGSPTPAARSTGRSPTRRRWRRWRCWRAPRASSRRSRVRTRWPACPRSSPSSARTALLVVCLSGRGDKDMDTAARWFGLVDGRRRRRLGRRRMSRSRTLRAGRVQRAGRPLVGYLPAGFPTVDGSIELIAAMVDGGVDVVEVGLPVLRPGDGRPDDPGGRRGRARRPAFASPTSSRSSRRSPRLRARRW